MLNILRETGITFSVGQSLTSKDLNTLNSTINSLVQTVNTLLMGEVNVNLEEGTPNKQYTLTEAISLVPKGRRVRGLKVTFLDTSDRLVTYTFDGSDWENSDCWISGEDKFIDGGEW